MPSPPGSDGLTPYLHWMTTLMPNTMMVTRDKAAPPPSKSRLRCQEMGKAGVLAACREKNLS
jgi:hypothetical protein